MVAADRYMAWLQDAYAMELTTADVLDDHVAAASGHPPIQARLQHHLDVTRHHAELIQGCIERLGGATPLPGTDMSAAAGVIQGMMPRAPRDTLLNAILCDYGMQQYQIASYRSLIHASKQMGDEETERVCLGIERDERAMAEFLMMQIDPVTIETLDAESTTLARNAS